MELRYYLNGLEIADSTRRYIEEKITKLQKFVRGNITVAEVEIEQDKKGFYRVEVQLRIPGSRYIADNVSATLEEGCDIVYDTLAIQIKRSNKKNDTLKKRAQISIKKRFVVDGNSRFRKSNNT